MLNGFRQIALFISIVHHFYFLRSYNVFILSFVLLSSFVQSFILRSFIYSFGHSAFVSFLRTFVHSSHFSDSFVLSIVPGFCFRFSSSVIYAHSSTAHEVGYAFPC